MIHITAAIGVGFAFLLESMVRSVAPAIGAVLAGAILLGLLWRGIARTRRRRKD